MSLQGIITSNIAIGGVSFSSSNTIEDSGQISTDITLTAGDSGTLSTRTNNTEGELTLSTGHGISTGQKINLYWSGGYRYGVTVGTVNVNAVPISGGAGDNLPSQTTVITASLCTTINLDVIGNDVSMIIAQSTEAGNITFYEAGDAVIANVVLTAGYAWTWDEDNGYTNPLAGKTVIYALAATSSTSASAFKVALLYDSES